MKYPLTRTRAASWAVDGNVGGMTYMMNSPDGSVCKIVMEYDDDENEWYCRLEAPQVDGFGEYVDKRRNFIEDKNMDIGDAYE